MAKAKKTAAKKEAAPVQPEQEQESTQAETAPEEKMVEIPENELRMIGVLLSQLADNTQDLLGIHLHQVGEATHKNRVVANMYRTEIQQAQIAKQFFKKAGVDIA